MPTCDVCGRPIEFLRLPKGAGFVPKDPGGGDHECLRSAGETSPTWRVEIRVRGDDPVVREVVARDRSEAQKKAEALSYPIDRAVGLSVTRITGQITQDARDELVVFVLAEMSEDTQIEWMNRVGRAGGVPLKSMPVGDFVRTGISERDARRYLVELRRRKTEGIALLRNWPLAVAFAMASVLDAMPLDIPV